MRVSAFLLCVLLCACRSETDRQGITVLLESPADSLDDRLALSANGQRVAQLIAPGLMTFDDQSRSVPDLAESVTQESPISLVFKLRPNLTFHDGSPLTAEDVKATFEGLRDPALKSPKADKFEPIERIDVLDERTVRFTLKRPYSPILAELSISIVPRSRARMPEARVQDRAPVGAGPFRFVAQPDEEHIELAPFDGYYGGKPKISKLTFRVVRDETTRVLELMKGRADLLVNAVSPAVLPTLERSDRLRVLTKSGTGWAYMGLNVRQGPLSDPRVRRAVCHALNTGPIIEHKFHNLAEPATGILPRAHWAYAPTAGCPYDPAKAKALLDAAGFPDPDGDGPKPRLELSFKTSTDRFRKSVALVLKEQLSQVGIAIDLRALEFGTFFSDVKKGNFELFTLKFPAVIEPDLLRYVFASTQIPSAANNLGGLNRSGYASPELDALLSRATEVFGEERAKLYVLAQQLIDAELPLLPLWHETSVAVVSNRLQDYQPSAHGFFRPLENAREVEAR